MNGKTTETMPKKISDLTAKTTLNNTDSFPLSDGVLGSDRRITRDSLKTALGIDAIEEGQIKGVIGYEDKATMDANTTADTGTVALVTNDTTASNNGYYRWNGTSWVKRASFYAETLDPTDTSEAVVGKAVGDYTIRSKRLNDVYPFTKSATAPDLEIFEGIIDIKLNGTKSSNNYSLYYIRRNFTAQPSPWQLRIYENNSGTWGEVCQFLSVSNPEPDNDDSISVHQLSEVNSSGISGEIAVRWSAITDGVTYNTVETLILSENAWIENEFNSGYLYSEVENELNENSTDKAPSGNAVAKTIYRNGRVSTYHPFLDTATTSQLEIFKSIIDIELIGPKSSNDYSLYYVRRNDTGQALEWQLRIYENDGGWTEVCGFITGSNPEPDNVNEITVHDLSEINSSGITGRIAVRWGSIEDGANYTTQSGLVLSNSVWRNKGYNDYFLGNEEENVRANNTKWGEWNLKQFRANVAKIKNLNGSGLSIAIIGDSWINADFRLYDPVRDYINSLVGVKSCGYISANSEISLPDGATRSISGTWADERLSGRGPEGAESTTTDEAAYISFGQNFGTVQKYIIHYLNQPNGGTFSYAIGAGSSTSVDTSNASESYETVEVVGADDLNIEIVSAGTAGVTFFGVEVVVDNGSEAVVHKLGNNGATGTRYTTIPQAFWESAFTSLSPDVCLIVLGINDHSQSETLSTFRGNINEMVSRLRNTNQYMDIMLVGPGPSNLDKSLEISDYNNQMYNLARENDLTFIDLEKYFGSWTEADARGLYSDSVHPNADGGEVIGQAIRSILKSVE